MSAQKTIAIVGATGNPGNEIACQFAFTGYRLLLISNDISKLIQLKEGITCKEPKAEIDAIECVKDGCWEADIIILAVAVHEEKEVAEMMKEVATQKIVVDVSNEEKAGEYLQQILPYSKLVMVSGNLSAKEMVISGEDGEVNEEIAEIFNQAGYYSTIVQSIHH
ncbi:MAG: NAD(P)-binding domain-containing protein [Ginsengibacter sp.]